MIDSPGASASGLHHAARQQMRQVGREAAPSTAGDEDDEARQHRATPAVAIGQRSDRKLAEREHDQEDRDRRGNLRG